MARLERKVGKNRMTLDFTDKERESINQLQTTTSARSAVEVVARAILLYETMLKLRKDGVIIIKNPDGTEKTLLLL